jgi:hypothetical protein
MTPERAVTADDLAAALDWAYTTFVAEPKAAARPINYQALAPAQTRERLWRTFEKRDLFGPRRVQRLPVLQGRHSPWTFDLSYKNGALHLINSLALNAAPEANLGRALIFRGMLEEIQEKHSPDVRGIALIQPPKPELREDAATPRALAILEDANIDTYEIDRINELADRVERDLSGTSRRSRSAAEVMSS